MSYLVGNPDDRFSRVAAHVVCGIHSIFPSSVASQSHQDNISMKYMSHLVGKPTMWFPNRSDTNQAVQAQKMARGWKFWI